MKESIGYTRSYHWEWLTPAQRELGQKLSAEINEAFHFPIKFPMAIDTNHAAIFILSEFDYLCRNAGKKKWFDNLIRIINHYDVRVLSESGRPYAFVIESDA